MKEEVIEPEIFKFQRPIMTNDPSMPVLFYNEDQSIIGEFPLTEKERQKVFSKGEYKTYWLCRFNEKAHKFDLIKQVKEQDW